MALFGFKKKEEVQASQESASAPVKKEMKAKAVRKEKITPTSAVTADVAHVLRNPRITEKGTMIAGESAYLFDVAPYATKSEIVRAIIAIYKVTPRMIRIVTIPAKRKRNARTGRIGVKSGGKKAYVYLMKGETITLA